MSWPLALIAFNRPWYLEQTLKSLISQKEADPPEPIALFCDGAVNPKSGERYATDSEVRLTIATFRRLCPKGEVFDSALNIGIAANIDRAERWAFLDLKAEAALIFEDDLVVTPWYLRALYELIDLALEDERIGSEPDKGLEGCIGCSLAGHAFANRENAQLPAGFSLQGRKWDWSD